jgi:biotin carboxylase
VICVAADAPMTVAAVSKKLGLPGLSFQSARLASDKLAMKERFRDSGVPVPWFSQVARRRRSRASPSSAAAIW